MSGYAEIMIAHLESKLEKTEERLARVEELLWQNNHNLTGVGHYINKENDDARNADGN